MDIDSRISDLKEKISKANDSKIRIEEKLNQLKEEYKNIIKELKELKVDPAKINDIITETEKNLITKLSKIEDEIEIIENNNDIVENKSEDKKQSKNEADVLKELDDLLS